MHSSSRETPPRASATAGPPVLTVPDIAALSETPWGLDDYSPLGEYNFLLLDVTGAAEVAQLGQLAAVAQRLRRMPCPVIAVGAVTAPAILRGVDAIVGSVQEAAGLIRNIDMHPLAAMTLVQLLRHNEDATPEQGLLAESLAYASLQGGAEFARVRAQLRAGGQRSALPPDLGDAVLVERSGDELHITLNRPHVRNAYSARMRDGLYEALQLLHVEKALHAVITGAGGCFCVGGDLAEFGEVPDTATAHAIRATRSVGQSLLELSARLEFRLHRACIGSGIELPAFAARVVAAADTFIQLPEITLGLLPGAGGTVSIPRRIGRHRTAYLALSARRINAATARQWGLVDAIS
jgi:enoyl-CoA hydratase